MEQIANSVACAAIDAGANILAYPHEAKWGDEIYIAGHSLKLNQHFHMSYRMREDKPDDEYLYYVQPCEQALVRGARQIIKGRVTSALARPEDVAGDLGFIQDSYAAGFCREIAVAGLRTDSMMDKLIAIDGVPYVVIQAYMDQGLTKILLDRPLEKPVTQTSALTGGRLDTHKCLWGVYPGGLYVVCPKHTDRPKRVVGSPDEAFTRSDYEKHGVHVRETRWDDNPGTTVTIDFLMGIKIYPQHCWFK